MVKDNASRTVLLGDANMPCDCVGVPKSEAMKLTKRVRVTPQNIDFLEKCVENGPLQHPGAKSVTSEVKLTNPANPVPRTDGVSLLSGFDSIRLRRYAER